MMALNATRPKRLTGTLAGIPPYEQAAIITMAEAWGIPPEALAAIRVAENGRGGGPGEPSLAFGVLSPPVAERDEYGEQCRLAAESVGANVVRYQKATGLSAWTGSRLSDSFWAFMGARWAPVGAANDPGGLNQHWVKNVVEAYRGGGCEWA